jgi:hypothetical protein
MRGDGNTIARTPADATREGQHLPRRAARDAWLVRARGSDSHQGRRVAYGGLNPYLFLVLDADLRKFC